MSVSIVPVVRDPTLYRAMVFVAWLPYESQDDSSRRVSDLQRVLEAHEWVPCDRVVVGRRSSTRTQRVLWGDRASDWAPKDAWNTHRFAMAYHEELVVLLGVEQDGLQPGDDGWHREAERSWGELFGQDASWRSWLATPDMIDPGGRPRLLGEAWVWTAEWQSPPIAGWEAYGRHQYAEGGFAVFPWGLLGLRALDRNELPRLDVHTATDDWARKARDIFLFDELTVLLSAYTKNIQFTRARVEWTIDAMVDRLEDRILAIAREPIPRVGRISLHHTHAVVQQLNDLLFEFYGYSATLREDVVGARIARDVIVQVLARSDAKVVDGKDGDFLLSPHDLLIRQIESDLAYFRTMGERGERALLMHRTILEIEQARGQDRLAGAGLIVAAFFGLGQVFQDDLPWEMRLICIVTGLTGAVYYWRRLTA